MRIWKNLQNMKEQTYLITKRGLQLTALFLLIGCHSIRLGDLYTADLFRQISVLALLFTAIITPCIELHTE